MSMQKHCSPLNNNCDIHEFESATICCLILNNLGCTHQTCKRLDMIFLHIVFKVGFVTLDGWGFAVTPCQYYLLLVVLVIKRTGGETVVKDTGHYW